MLNTFPITEVRRPPYLFVRAYGSGGGTGGSPTNGQVRICLLDRTGSIYSSSSYSPPAPGETERAFIRSAYSDDVLFGDVAGIKRTIFDSTGMLNPNSGAFSTNANVVCGGISNTTKTLMTGAHTVLYQFSWSFSEKTGSSTYSNIMNTMTRTGSFANSSGLARGYMFVGKSASANALIGGDIGQWQPENGSFRYLNCSASAALDRVAAAAYDTRRNVIWSAVRDKIIAHDIDSGNLIESRSFSFLAPDSGSISDIAYNSFTDELYISGYLMKNIRIINLTLNTTRSITTSSFNLDDLYTIDFGGGIEKLT